MQSGDVNKKLGFGLMRLPIIDERDRSTVDVDQLCDMVDLYLSRGFSYFDTAHRYNDFASEPAIRKALVERYDRSAYRLADKVTINFIKSEADLEPFFDKQLAACGVDYFDNYLVHNMGSSKYAQAQECRTFEFISRLKDTGKVKHIGFSFHDSPEVLAGILKDHPEVEYVQLQLNYLDWDDPVIRSRECYEVARAFDKRVLVMEPIKGGTLINVPADVKDMLLAADQNASLASWALRFVAGLDGVEMVLSGMSTLAQIDDNTTSMTDFDPLNETEKSLLNKAVLMIRASAAIPCTGCGYCAPVCKKDIPIPDVFSVYNNKMRLKNDGYFSNQVNYYMNITKDRGKASECLHCGKCEKECPQHLSIREYMEICAESFEGRVDGHRPL